MAEKKVYCEDCKFLVFCVLPDRYYCYHPLNMTDWTKDTWLRPVVERQKADPPWKINANNNCKWFEQKEEEDGKVPEA